MSNYIDNIVKNAVTYDLVSKPLASDMANEFSIQSTYAVGDYVMHDYKLYKCISAVTTVGNWNSAKWQECKIGDEINGGVKFTAQTLTSEQKAQARNNIGSASQSDLEALNAVRYDQAQGLTTAQKTQARANIDAVSQEEATPDAIRYSAQSLTETQKNQARVNVGTVASTSIAEEFSTSKAYAVGDMVMYNSKLYKFKTAHSAGAWNNAQVDAISVDDELLNLKGDLDEKTLSDAIKDALLNCFKYVAWINNLGQSYYDELEEALYGPQWDYKWYANSQTLPEGMTATEYNFTQDPEALYVVTPNLSFDYVGNMRIVIECKMYTYDNGNSRFINSASPQISIKNQIVSQNQFKGIKVVAAVRNATENPNRYVGVVVNGAATILDGVLCEHVYHTYDLSAVNGVYTLLIDGNEINIPQNNNTTQYLTYSGIISARDVTDPLIRETMLVKKILFKRL